MWDVPKYKNQFGVVTKDNKFLLVRDNGRITRNNRNFKPYLVNSGFNRNNPIDAAITTTLGSEVEQKHQILFSGQTYTVYTSFMKKVSGPHSIYEETGPLKVKFPRYVKKFNAIYKPHTDESKIFFFFRLGSERKGYYYEYDTKKQQFLGRGVNRVSDTFSKFPSSGPDAAISSQRLGTYFILGKRIYKIDERYRTIIYGYPKEIGNHLIHCNKPGEQKSFNTKSLGFFRRLFSALVKG